LPGLDTAAGPGESIRFPTGKEVDLVLKRLAGLTCAALIAGAAMGLTATAASASALQGAGSTLVAPLEAYWGTAWANRTGQATPQYQAVGSGTGLKDIGSGLVDFGASDAPISASTTPCNGCFQIPWALSATGIGFNIPGVHRLHLTGGVLAKIYLGQIKKWNDHAITSLNRGTRLPNLTITPIHRADGSGDSYAFTDYLSAVSSAFRSGIGRGTKPSFPVGPGATGNTGMVTTMQGTSGAIAYIAVSYLIAHQLPAAALQNRAGKFEVPNLKNISNAASGVHGLPGNGEIHIVNPPRSDRIAYPLSTFTYVVVQPTDPLGNGSALKDFVNFALSTQGQSFGPRLDFAPLPTGVRRADLGAAARIR
jgi:phosphate transport system substrate-binding protein